MSLVLIFWRSSSHEMSKTKTGFVYCSTIAFAAEVCYTVCEIEFYECQSARLSHTEVSPGGETSGTEGIRQV